MGVRLYSAGSLVRASLLQLFYSTAMNGADGAADLTSCSAGSWVLGIDDEVWNHSVFSKNRDRLLTTEDRRDFLAALLAEPKVSGCSPMSNFSVDGRATRLGFDEELSPKDGSGSPRSVIAMASGTSAARSVPDETHGSKTRSGRPAYRKGPWARRASLLPGACPDGEPERFWPVLRWKSP